MQGNLLKMRKKLEELGFIGLNLTKEGHSGLDYWYKYKIKRKN